ncbi:hypothetical protein CR969_00880 [Candidatus Saccharibacteria bacterium]|nr:MAG: hypothetical protein CR969_00880 [Candidatus Saccharibacteria bacterium]
MSKELELELTFLAKEIPEEVKGKQSVRITDVYVPDSVAHPNLRLRQKGDKFEITKKIMVNDNDASEQVEHTIELTEAEFKDLAKSSQKVVAKDRYLVELCGRSAEVDVFVGGLKGLVLIDFEFDNPTDKTNFKTPEMVLADVTQEEFTAGGKLAGKTYADIAKDLDRFGYKPL